MKQDPQSHQQQIKSTLNKKECMIITGMQVLPSSKNLQNAEDVVTKGDIVKSQMALKQAQECNKCFTLYIIDTIGLTSHLR